jgi:hypothetical protein
VGGAEQAVRNFDGNVGDQALGIRKVIDVTWKVIERIDFTG